MALRVVSHTWAGPRLMSEFAAIDFLSNVKDPAAETTGSWHRRSDLPCSANLYTLDEARAFLDDPVRDKRYLETTLGPAVRDFLVWFRQSGASARTLDTYERI